MLLTRLRAVAGVATASGVNGRTGQIRSSPSCKCPPSVSPSADVLQLVRQPDQTSTPQAQPMPQVEFKRKRRAVPTTNGEKSIWWKLQ